MTSLLKKAHIFKKHFLIKAKLSLIIFMRFQFMMAQRRKSIYFSKRASKTKYLFPKFKNLNAKMC